MASAVAMSISPVIVTTITWGLFVLGITPASRALQSHGRAGSGPSRVATISLVADGVGYLR